MRVALYARVSTHAGQNPQVQLAELRELVFGIFASIAEFERELIRDRVRSGIALARAQGKRIGRPRRPVDANRVRELRALGWSWVQIARELGAGLGTVHRQVNKRNGDLTPANDLPTTRPILVCECNRESPTISSELKLMPSGKS
jgi:DNA invertase Pin-like site-specific DNA recombinase